MDNHGPHNPQNGVARQGLTLAAHGFGGEVGVGDLAAHDADQIGLTGGEQFFGAAGVGDVRLGLHFGEL